MGTLPLAAKERARQRLAAVGVPLLDAPVSGTGLQADDATLVVYSSGDEAGHRRAEPVFSVIGSRVHYLGAFGNGSRMKYLANLLVAVQTVAAAEAHALGAASGLDAEVVQEVIESGVGTSAMFEIRGPMMVEGRYDPPAARLDIILKDATIIAEHARSLGVPTPLLERALSVVRAGSEAGLGGLDAAAVRLLFEDPTEALEPPGRRPSGPD
jgi:3-hydroxyisobutyrate dehydrogenase-like beta-hydroxyacid dehydrogenase